MSQDANPCQEAELESKEMPLLTRGRLSVQPVPPLAYDAICLLGEKGGHEHLLAAASSAKGTDKSGKGPAKPVPKGGKRKASEEGGGKMSMAKNEQDTEKRRSKRRAK